jgi:hypothetical protein
MLTIAVLEDKDHFVLRAMEASLSGVVLDPNADVFQR